MILSAEELDWVTKRMKVYDIKYQEIYNELFDHILTAIEAMRLADDDRDITIVFQEVVDSHFGGYLGIEDVAAKQEKTYTTHIRKSFSKIFWGYFNWKLGVFTAIALGLTLKLPDVKPMHNTLLVAICFFAISPMVYTYITVSRKLEISKGRRSLLKGQLVTQAYLPAMFLNGALYLPAIFFVNDESSAGFKLYKQLPLPVLMLVMILFMVLNLSVVSLCRQVINRTTAR
jgi:hypothetical protein